MESSPCVIFLGAMLLVGALNRSWYPRVMIKLLILIHALIPQSFAQFQLEGVWKQECCNSTVRTETFEGSFVMLKESYFTDAACTMPLMQFSSFGAHTVNAEQMDFRFMSVGVTLQREAMVTDFNNRQVCGYNNWKLNNEKNLVGLTCKLFNQVTNTKIPDENEMRYGIYKIEGNRLYLGQLTSQNNGLKPEARPTEWNSQHYTKDTEPHEQSGRP